VFVVPAFFIMLREGVEAALVVGIVASYLVRIGRQDALPRVWLGTGLAVALSLFVGIGVLLTIGRLPLVVQETAEGLAAVVAVGVLTWMLFWMRRQGRRIKGDLEHGVQVALSAGSLLALAGLAFVSVLREGLETVLFMAAVFSAAGPGPTPAIGAVAGLLAAVLVGVAIFQGGRRINLGRFFTITGVILIPVAAGLCAFGVHAFGEGGLIANGPAIWDLGGILPESSPLGALLAGIFGYREAPTALEVAAYLAYLLPVSGAYLVLVGRQSGQGAAATVAAPPPSGSGVQG
jgi:high-affinity iron transporter